MITPDEELLKAYGSTHHTRSPSDHLTDLRAVRAAVDARWQSEMEYQRRVLASALRLPKEATWIAILDSVRDNRRDVKELVGLLQWCSGSADFNDGGVAREGWLAGPAIVLKKHEKEP